VDEYKCAFLRDKLGIYEDLVQLCLRAGSTEKVEEAWSYAEAAKSRALVDLLAANREIQGKTPDVADSSMQQQWHDLREQLDWFYNRISEVEWRNPGRPDRSVHQWRKEVRQREHALMKLMQQMRIEDAEYASLRTVSRMDMAELRACLADDEILVEYFVVNDRIKVFVIDADGLRGCYDVTTLGAIAPVLRRFQFNLKKVALRASSRRDDTSQAVTSDHGQDDHATFSQAHADQSLQLLYTRLIEPIRSLLEGKNLHIVPHGLLHYIPFHALYDGREYMIDRHEISYAPSAGVLKLCVDKANQLRKAEGRRQKAEGGSQEITSSLNNPQSAIRHPQSGGALIMGIPDQMMPSIANEVGMVASLWPGARVYVGADATISRLKQIAPECRLLHVASHGVFRHDNPMFSALKLSDSWLNFYDIFNLALNAELVTLSACETGINEVFPGDELFGLMRGFLYAGAPSLMVSLWAVHDNSTAQFMQLFYTALNEGQSKRAAIRHAYLGVKQNNSHPCYWAPFILMGAP
jgi:CHAT domain-containing protein